VSSYSLCDHVLDELFYGVKVVRFVVLLIEYAVLFVSESYTAKAISASLITVITVVHVMTVEDACASNEMC